MNIDKIFLDYLKIYKMPDPSCDIWLAQLTFPENLSLQHRYGIKA